MRYMRLLLTIWTPLTLLTSANAQNSSCDTRTVLVSVLNAKRQTLSNLKPENFIAEAEGKPLEVVSVVANTPPRRIVVLLDTSGSMQGQRLANAQQLAIAIASSADSNTEVSAYTFGDGLEYVGASSDKSRLLENLRVLRVAKGRTALLAAIMRVLSELKNAGPQDMLYVLSDGGDNRSKASLRDVIHVMLDSGVHFSAAAFPDPWAATDEERSGPANLRDIATATGGFFSLLGPWDPVQPSKDSVKEIALLAEMTKRQFKLTLNTAEKNRSLQKLKLKLYNLPMGVKGFRILHPSTLPACSSTN